MASASLDERRRTIAALAAERDQSVAPGRFGRWLLVAGLALALIVALLLWMFGFFSTPPAVAAIEKLVDQQVAEYDRAARGDVPFESVAGFGAIADKLRDVPREYRSSIGRQMGRLGDARERAETASFFSLPPDQRQAELDRRIRAEEQRAQRRQAEREKSQAEREKRDAARAASGQQAAAGSRTAGGNAGPPATGGGPPTGSRRTSTEEARNDRSKQRIDRSSPEERAQRTEYRRAIEARRKQLGLPASGSRRG
jgi:hypothetical protein